MILDDPAQNDPGELDGKCALFSLYFARYSTTKLCVVSSAYRASFVRTSFSPFNI